MFVHTENENKNCRRTWRRNQKRNKIVVRHETPNIHIVPCVIYYNGINGSNCLFSYRCRKKNYLKAYNIRHILYVIHSTKLNFCCWLVTVFLFHSAFFSNSHVCGRFNKIVGTHVHSVCLWRAITNDANDPDYWIEL